MSLFLSVVVVSWRVACFSLRCSSLWGGRVESAWHIQEEGSRCMPDEKRDVGLPRARLPLLCETCCLLEENRITRIHHPRAAPEESRSLAG